jgi:hypothetical protein
MLVAVVLAASTLAGCAKQGAPEQVADAFVEAYFRRADQERAKEFTALGATEMLDKELKDVAQVRKQDYSAGETVGAEVSYHRGAPSKRDERVRVPYEIVVKIAGAETVRDADVELANIRGVWKVVRLGMKTR